MREEYYPLAGLGLRLDFAGRKSAFHLRWNPVSLVLPVEVSLIGPGSVPASSNTFVAHLGGSEGHIRASLQA